MSKAQRDSIWDAVQEYESEIDELKATIKELEQKITDLEYELKVTQETQ